MQNLYMVIALFLYIEKKNVIEQYVENTFHTFHYKLLMKSYDHIRNYSCGSHSSILVYQNNNIKLF